MLRQETGQREADFFMRNSSEFDPRFKARLQFVFSNKVGCKAI